MTTAVPKLKETLNSGNTTSETVKWKGGSGAFGFTGTFDGATGSLQVSYDAGTSWCDIGADYDIDGSDATTYAFGPLPPCHIRLSLASAGGSTDLVGFIQ